MKPSKSSVRKTRSRSAVLSGRFAVLASSLALFMAAPATADSQQALASYAGAGQHSIGMSREGPDCQIFFPQTEEGSHPVVVWGNGTGAGPSSYYGLLMSLASRGYIVVAAMTPRAGRGLEMYRCMMHLLEQNDSPQSQFNGRVDSSRIAAVGHSQGGGGAIMLGRNEHISTTVAIQPYTTGFGHSPQAAGRQNGPMLLLSGGEDYVASALTDQQPVYEAANVPVFWATLQMISHMDAVGDAGPYRPTINAWLDWQLKGDEQAGALFTGDNCVICTDLAWEVRSTLE